MAADINDKFTKAFNSANPNVARVTVARSALGSTLTCDSLTGWPTETAVHFSTYRLNSSNEVIAGTQIDWKGIVSGSVIGTLTRQAGAADTGSAIGDVVEMNPTGSWVNDLMDGLLVAHSVAGVHKDDSITPAMWTNPYCFRAYDSVGTTLTDNTLVTISLGTEEYDYNSNFASNTYTAPVDGVYHFSGAFNISGAVSSGIVAYATLYKNGSEAARGDTSPPTSGGSFTVTSDLLLAAGDTVTLRGLQDSAAGEVTSTGSALTYLSGHLVRAS